MTMTPESEDDARARRQLTEAQLEAIEDEIRSTQPLTSPLLPLSALARQYASGPGGGGKDDDDGRDGRGEESDAERRQREGFLGAATFLSTKYESLRRVRGDGNCYYRAFLYSLCERLLRRRGALLLARDDDDDGENDDEDGEFERLKELVAGSLKWVCRFGYDEYTIDMFHEELVELFDFIEGAFEKKSGDGDDNSNSLEDALKQLHSRLNEENACSDYCTWFMRVLTAAQMKSDPDRYLPFLIAEGNDHYADVSAFCAREVEPMGRECGMVQVSALAERMGVRVVIEYVDG
eukprot:CAMPEP_0172526070 /NCGR_PEP_ID=MMETSP1067-20121228/1084_1 /TAXON_ID=265564 ORGANISM="Thalassiosira punctigera, Strain Tpunct2005C2" /NCGR_SAMPLE_ID=MMETSP1067 /ASSEMBLY_ACC=CAM_ASM_000444 /LENGTH=292 /DNA_ID=CAMNT_0013309505 /DNA_START=9 /DNA_END=884 /DNA_ORIENTATION=+